MSGTERRRRIVGKNCMFVSMVPTVITLFVLYIIVYMGTMTDSLKAENFTISDALSFPPPQVLLAHNIEAMAKVALKRPRVNQFMDDSDTSETKENYEAWVWPTRPTTLEANYNSELKRGPALTFIEPSAKSIEPFQTKFNASNTMRNNENGESLESTFVNYPEYQFEKEAQSQRTSYQSFAADNFEELISRSNSRMDFFPDDEDMDVQDVDFSKFSQEDLEADYFEERKQFGEEAAEDGKSDQILTPASFATEPKAYEELALGESRFDQLVTYRPKVEDKSGYHNDNQQHTIGNAQIIHHKSGYSDHGGGGYSDHGSYSEHEDSYSDHKPKGGYVAQRNPGPYGYPSPNFKCEYAKETLYVTKTEWTFDKKCFTVYRTKCRQEYEHGKGIGFQKECSEFTVTKCRTEYDTESDTKCWTVFRKDCFQVYVTKVDWEYEEKCETKYEEVCEGYGYDKHCEQVPKEHCHQIPVKVEKQVPKTKCKKVPEKKCQDFPIFIPRKACKDFPKTVCVKDPINVPRKIPKKVCASIPKEVCNKIPVQIIKHVPKTVTKKVCTSTKPSGYSPYSDDASYHPPESSHSYHQPEYHTSHSQQAPTYKAPHSGQSDVNVNHYFDGVADVPHFNYE